MTKFICLKPNEHLKVEFLRSVLEDWGVGNKYKNLKNKKEIIQAINGEFPSEFQPVYLKIYVVENEGKVFAVNGRIPDRKATHGPEGLTSFLNTIKQGPQKFEEFVNKTENFVSQDDLVNSKVKKIKEGTLVLEDLMPRIRDAEAALPQDEPEIQVFSNNPVETEIHSDSSTHQLGTEQDDSCMTRSNKLDVGKLLKIPSFDENTTSVSDWINDIKYGLTLARVTDMRTAIASMIFALPKNLAPRVRTALNRRQEDPTRVTIEDFKQVLEELTHKSVPELERELNELSFDNRKFRDFYLRIEQKIKKFNPEIKDKKALDTLMTREFGNKVPSHVQKNVTFKTSTIVGIELAALAESVHEVTKNATEVNNIKTKADKSAETKVNHFQKNSRGTYRGRGRGNGGGRGLGGRGGGSYRGGYRHSGYNRGHNGYHNNNQNNFRGRGRGGYHNSGEQRQQLDRPIICLASGGEGHKMRSCPEVLE